MCRKVKPRKPAHCAASKSNDHFVCAKKLPLSGGRAARTGTIFQGYHAREGARGSPSILTAGGAADRACSADTADVASPRARAPADTCMDGGFRGLRRR